MDRSSTFEPDPGAIRRRRRSVHLSFSRRLVARAIVTALLVLGVAAPAAAAGLGGLSSGGPGAETALVGSCDSDGVGVAYQTGSSASGQPTVTGVVLSALHPSCTGSTLHLTISGDDGAQLGTGTAPVTGSAQTITVATPIDATAVAGTALVITG